MPLSDININTSDIMGPAVTAAMITSMIAFMSYIVKSIIESRDKRRKKINAAEILSMEIQEGINALDLFIPAFIEDAKERGCRVQKN